MKKIIQIIINQSFKCYFSQFFESFASFDLEIKITYPLFFGLFIWNFGWKTKWKGTVMSCRLRSVNEFRQFDFDWISECLIILNWKAHISRFYLKKCLFLLKMCAFYTIDKQTKRATHLWKSHQCAPRCTLLNTLVRTQNQSALLTQWY